MDAIHFVRRLMQVRFANRIHVAREGRSSSQKRIRAISSQSINVGRMCWPFASPLFGSAIGWR